MIGLALSRRYFSQELNPVSDGWICHHRDNLLGHLAFRCIGMIVLRQKIIDFSFGDVAKI